MVPCRCCRAATTMPRIPALALPRAGLAGLQADDRLILSAALARAMGRRGAIPFRSVGVQDVDLASTLGPAEPGAGVGWRNEDPHREQQSAARRGDGGVSESAADPGQ